MLSVRVSITLLLIESRLFLSQIVFVQLFVNMMYLGNFQPCQVDAGVVTVLEPLG